MDGDATVRFDLSTTMMENICDFTWDSALWESNNFTKDDYV